MRVKTVGTFLPHYQSLFTSVSLPRPVASSEDYTSAPEFSIAKSTQFGLSPLKSVRTTATPSTLKTLLTARLSQSDATVVTSTLDMTSSNRLIPQDFIFALRRLLVHPLSYLTRFLVIPVSHIFPAMLIYHLYY